MSKQKMSKNVKWGGGIFYNNKLTSNKKYIVLLLIFLLGILTIYINTSYGLFKKKDFLTDINFIAGTLNYKITSDYLDENNKIVIAKNSDTEINLVLTSLNEIDSKYEIYYNILTDNVDNEDIEVGYTSTSFDSVVGTISSNGTKTVVLKLINNSDKDVQIEIGCEGGLVNNELVLTKGITTNHEINDGDIILAYNLDGPSELYPENFPKKDDGYKVTGVTCNGADAVWDNENWNVTISNMTGKTITCIVDLSVELVYDFAYKGYVEEFKVPYTGNYKLEVWGAQGGNYNASCIGGYGGYSIGVVSLEKGETISIAVGGSGSGNGTFSAQTGGFNGGGSATRNSSDTNLRISSGGGATHIATSNRGELSNYENYKDELLIVAGSGGGASANIAIMCVSGGSGGGYSGNDGQTYTESANGFIFTGYGGSDTGGKYYSSADTSQINLTHFSEGTFGTGASAIIVGAGAGYYGGGVGAYSAGGGSGYIANPKLTSKYMYCYNCKTLEETDKLTYSTTTNVSIDPISDYVKIGNGYARITYIGE